MLQHFWPLMKKNGRVVVVSSTNSQYAKSLIRCPDIKQKLCDPELNLEELDKLADRLVADAVDDRPPLQVGCPLFFCIFDLGCAYPIHSRVDEFALLN